MSNEIAEWLQASPRIVWETEFAYLLNSSTSQVASQNQDGLSLFVQGLNAECKEKNTRKALNLYRQGATKLDPLCLCRLHEIYTGDPAFKTEANIDRAVVYLVFAGLYSQDIDFEDAMIPFKKLRAFLSEFDPKCQLIGEIFERISDDAVDPAMDFTYHLLLDFQQIDQERQRSTLVKLLEAMPQRAQKNILYTIYLSELRLPWQFAVQKKENLVLKMMQNPEIFESFFDSYKGLILLANANKTIIHKFHTWLQTIPFVIDFAALSPAKKAYYHMLMPFVSQALEKNVFDSQDTQCWLRYFLAYCYEKGVNGTKDLKKAGELIRKNIEESPEGVNYPLRQAILFKQMGKTNESTAAINKFENLYAKRAKQVENSLLFYARAKSFEKVYDEADNAIKYYTKGTAEPQVDTQQNTYFFYSYWRIRCTKKLNKLKQAASGVGKSTSANIVLAKKLTAGSPVKSEAPLVPLVKPSVKEPTRNPLLVPETKKVFNDMRIRVFSDREVRAASKGNSNTVIVNNEHYYAEQFEFSSTEPIKKNSKDIERLFTEHNNPKLEPAEGVYLKEKDDLVSVSILTPKTALNLSEALQANMFYDVKTKVHVASQIALCLQQIHEEERGAFYGSLKPKKILLDEYFGVTLHDSCSKLQPYQVLESDGYVAPEQFQDSHGPYSDIWAFGTILRELLIEHKVDESHLKKGEMRSLRGVEQLIENMTKSNPRERVGIKEVYETLRGIYHKVPRI